jgi:hypothetical protein
VPLSSEGAGEALTVPHAGRGGPLRFAAVSEGARLAVLVPHDRVVALVDPGSPEKTVVVDLAEAEPSGQLGAPVLNGRRLYVPDNGRARVLVFDTVTGRTSDPVVLGEVPTTLEVFVKDGRVWINDPAGPRASVVDAAGHAIPIEKYRDDGSGPSIDARPAPPPEAAGRQPSAGRPPTGGGRVPANGPPAQGGPGQAPGPGAGAGAGPAAGAGTGGRPTATVAVPRPPEKPEPEPRPEPEPEPTVSFPYYIGNADSVSYPLSPGGYIEQEIVVDQPFVRTLAANAAWNDARASGDVFSMRMELWDTFGNLLAAGGVAVTKANRDTEIPVEVGRVEVQPGVVYLVRAVNTSPEVMGIRLGTPDAPGNKLLHRVCARVVGHADDPRPSYVPGPPVCVLNGNVKVTDR